MPLAVGEQAPDFTLKTKMSDGLEDVRLSDNFGKRNSVLLFFPLAFTGVCTKELCQVGASLGDYRGLDAEVYGISVDSPFAQEAWARQEGIGLPLLSDLGARAASAYGVALDDVVGLGPVAARAAVVVDRDGVVRYSEQTATPAELPDFEAVRQTLAELG